MSARCGDRNIIVNQGDPFPGMLELAAMPP